jgi:cell division protein FtsQ
MDRRLQRQGTVVGEAGRAVAGREKKVQRRLKNTLLFFVFLWMLLTFVRSDFFSLEKIVTEGHVYLTEAEIRTALQVSEGENIWRIRPSLLEERVTSIPRVSSATVERRLPRTLVVSVREEETLILVPYREHLLEVGKDGQVLGSTRERQVYSLPLLTGTGPVEISVGQTMLDGWQLAAVRAVMAALEEHGLHASELNLADPENMILIMMDGLVVWLGRGEYAEKIWLLQQISRRLPEEKQGGYLDLRVREAPVFSGGGGKNGK